jgi:hypothetical protein
MITVAVTGKRKFKVLNIDPSPVIRKKDLNSLVSKLEALYYHNPSQEFKPIKLGADPEFMLFNSKSGKMVAASEFFPREGIVGCDNIRIPNRQQRPVAEIRPSPELSPHILIDNIRHALKTANKMAPYRKVKWVAGSHPTGNYSIGGHIHFSNIKLSYAVLRALDNFVAIPIFLIENPITAGLRRKKYGAPGDFRTKNHGGFEYRTLASWLVSPDITRGVLCLAKIAVSHYGELNKNYFASLDAQKAFYRGDQEYFKPIFEDLWSKICQTDMYQQYVDELKIIHDMIIDNKRWNEKHDLCKTWEIGGFSKKKYSISSNKKMSKLRKPETTRNINSRNIISHL